MHFENFLLAPRDKSEKVSLLSRKCVSLMATCVYDDDTRHIAAPTRSLIFSNSVLRHWQQVKGVVDVMCESAASSYIVHWLSIMRLRSGTVPRHHAEKRHRRHVFFLHMHLQCELLVKLFSLSRVRPTRYTLFGNRRILLPGARVYSFENLSIA